jgi:hypothetical protein
MLPADIKIDVYYEKTESFGSIKKFQGSYTPCELRKEIWNDLLFF